MPDTYLVTGGPAVPAGSLQRAIRQDRASATAPINQICAGRGSSWHALVDVQITGGYARASYASGGGGASRVPRIAGDVTAGPALVSCVLVGYAPCVERRRF